MTAVTSPRHTRRARKPGRHRRQLRPLSAGAAPLPVGTGAARQRPCLVLIPGTLCDRRLFEAQARALRTQARVIRVDLRRLDEGVDAWAAALLHRLPLRFSLAGFSLGGLLALELLRRAPERVDRLALIASNAEPASRRAQVRRRAQRVLLERGGTAAVVRALLPSYLEVPRPRARHGGLIERMAQATPAESARAQFDWAASRPDGHAGLAAHTAPLLVVSGADDALCPRAQQQRLLATRPDARWLELRRCGHFIPLERPRQLSRLLAQWLAAPPRGV